MSNKQPVLNYYELSSDVTAFSTTRHGGVSDGNYASLNINEYCGDSKDNTDTNRQLLATELDIDANHIIMPHQTHGVETRIIGKEFLSLPESVKKMLLEGVDAVMTDIQGICIGEAAEKSPDVGRRYRCKYLRISLKISNFTSISNTL